MPLPTHSWVPFATVIAPEHVPGTCQDAEDFAEAVNEIGMGPIKVTTHEHKIEIIEGERFWLASLMLGHKLLPIIITPQKNE